MKSISIIKFFLIFVLLITFSKTGLSQTKEADKMPSPVGGIMAIAKNVVYPEEAKKAGVEGKVFIEATIDENGNVIKTSVKQSIGSGFDEAAIEAIRKTKFTPGTKDGQAVKTSVTIPVQFKLDGKKK